MIYTKNWFTNPTSQIERSLQPIQDLGYSLDIPWNDIITTGWQESRPDIWGYENKIITRSDPEYFAPGNIIRTNVLPQININDPIYSFDRANYTYSLF